MRESDTSTRPNMIEIPDDWQPTPENVNALPMPLREYIHRLETDCDPAGTIRELVIAEDTIQALLAERDTQNTEADEDGGTRHVARRPQRPSGDGLGLTDRARRT